MWSKRVIKDILYDKDGKTNARMLLACLSLAVYTIINISISRSFPHRIGSHVRLVLSRRSHFISALSDGKFYEDLLWDVDHFRGGSDERLLKGVLCVLSEVTVNDAV